MVIINIDYTFLTCHVCKLTVEADTTARPTPSGGRLDCISVFLPEYNYDDDFHFSNGAYVGQIVQQLRKDLGCEKGCLVEETLLDNPVVGEEPTFSRLMRYDEVLVGGCYEFYSHGDYLF